jgi:hypothetical protein
MSFWEIENGDVPEDTDLLQEEAVQVGAENSEETPGFTSNHEI